MAMAQTEIQKLIQEAIPESHVEIIDLAGDGDHYEVHVSAPIFGGKSRIQQHRLVYDALGQRMGGELHALAIKTSTPPDTQREGDKNV
jgi:stress-induced morphogen